MVNIYVKGNHTVIWLHSEWDPDNVAPYAFPYAVALLFTCCSSKEAVWQFSIKQVDWSSTLQGKR